MKRSIMLLTSSLVVWTVLMTPVLYVLYMILTSYLNARRMSKAMDKFPSEPAHWLKGHLHLMPGVGEERLEMENRQTVLHPTCQKFLVGPFTPLLLVRHPDTMKTLLKSTEPKPLTLGIYEHGKPWIGDGLLMSQGQKWSRNRRLLTPAFHFDILKPYMKINNGCADLLLDKITQSTRNGISYEFYDNISLYTFDVILRCAMSYVLDVQTKGESHPYVGAVKRLGNMWIKRFMTPWMQNNILFWLSNSGRQFRKDCAYVHSLSEEVIRKRQESLKSDTGEDRSKRYLDFLDILLKAKDDDGKGLTFQEIRDEVDTFMFEGHDTTASAISWTLYSLAGHPQFRKKCQQEIDDVLKGRDSDDILWDDLPKFKFLSQCLKEAMRLHSPVPYFARVLTKDMEIDGKILPKDSGIYVQIYNLHHNPTVWENHMEFQPSRFDPDNIEKMDSFAFVPFSAGPRNCIGQNFAMHEMKTVIARILRRFTLSLDPNFKVTKQIGVVMRTGSGMMLRVAERAE